MGPMPVEVTDANLIEQKVNSTPAASKSSHLVKALRMVRPNFSVTYQSSASGSAEGFGRTLNASSRNGRTASAASRAPSPAPDHFAPMLSTLNMNPKIVLTRTPTASPVKKAVGAASVASRRQSSPYVLLEKIEKLQQPSCTLHRTMANLKGLDMIQVPAHCHAADPIEPIINIIDY